MTSGEVGRLGGVVGGVGGQFDPTLKFFKKMYLLKRE